MVESKSLSYGRMPKVGFDEQHPVTRRLGERAAEIDRGRRLSVPGIRTGHRDHLEAGPLLEHEPQ
jgi:hypothetical protein